MTRAEYHGLKDRLSATAIKAGRRSMLHMRLAATVTMKPTPAMEWGTLVHLAALEPARLLSEVAVWYGERRAGKAWESFRGENAGKTICNRADLDALGEITAAIRRNKAACDLLAGCEFERPVLWDGQGYGAAKALYDAYKPGVLVDLKTTARIDTATRQAWTMGYHLQMGWYWTGATVALRDNPECYLLFVEAEPPFDVRPVKLGYDVLEVGAKEAVRIATEYRACERANVWPGIAADGKVDVWNLEPWQQPGAPELEGATDAD